MNSFTKFFAPVVNFFKNLRQPEKFVGKVKSVPVTHKQAMAKKDAIAQVTFWKQVAKRRVRKGRAVKNPTAKYLRSLESL